MNFIELPKIELHCHLDGSLRPETVMALAKEQGIEVPNDLETLKQLLIAPEDCTSLDVYLERFELPNRLMQTKDNIERITYELFEDAANENVKYMEVRFGPLLHLSEGLSLDEVIESVLHGLKRAEQKCDIHGNIILSILRTMDKDLIDHVIEIGSKYIGKGVVAIDLAASEIEGFCSEFESYIGSARKKGFKVTIHAGETGYSSNVLDAIQLLKADRIGHGVAIRHDVEARTLVQKEKVNIEACPTSNVQTKAVETLEDHPIVEFIKEGISISVNTDNRTVSNTTMTKEIEKIFNLFNLDSSDYLKIYKESVDKSFASKSVKDYLYKMI